MCWVMPPASPGGDVGLADGVEERCLAVVDVAQDNDHRGPLDHVLRLVLDRFRRLFLVLRLLLRGRVAPVLDVQNEAVFLGHFLGHRLVDRRIHRGEADDLVELGDELEGLEAEGDREVSYDDRRLEMDDLDVALDGDERGARRGGAKLRKGARK